MIVSPHSIQNNGWVFFILCNSIGIVLWDWMPKKNCFNLCWLISILLSHFKVPGNVHAAWITVTAFWDTYRTEQAIYHV